MRFIEAKTTTDCYVSAFMQRQLMLMRVKQDVGLIVM